MPWNQYINFIYLQKKIAYQLFSPLQKDPGPHENIWRWEGEPSFDQCVESRGKSPWGELCWPNIFALGQSLILYNLLGHHKNCKIFDSKELSFWFESLVNPLEITVPSPQVEGKKKKKKNTANPMKNIASDFSIDKFLNPMLWLSNPHIL